MSDPIRDLKRELLAAAERQHRTAPVATGLRGRLLAPRRVLLVTASLSIAAALALVVSAPWSDSPGLLEQAQAALTAPPDTIRHDKVGGHLDLDRARLHGHPWAERGLDRHDAPVPVARPLRDLPMVEEDVSPDVTEPDCWKGITSELGGTSNPVCTAAGCEPILSFSAPNTLRISPISVGFPQTRCRAFETRLTNGLAHDEGTTQLGGRTVERIRLDPPGCDADQVCPSPTYAYVDPETFYPVEFHNPEFRGVRSVVRFLTFEYLPRTPANLKLTDIRAQHPGATVSGPSSSDPRGRQTEVKDRQLGPESCMATKPRATWSRTGRRGGR